ncbi:MAG TPA: hypothetical protein VME17_08010 [Bryobacteraceae bacterium]|nr:hypothetical protein [Bryobacteraceae bacterium]
MRSLTISLFVVSLFLCPTGCKRRHGPPAVVTDARAGDPQVAGRFTEGFYAIEANAWRWTAKDFAVTLNPPPHAAERGARLVMHLVIPDPVIQHSKFVELSSSIQGLKLDPQVFAKAGQYTYERDVPADKLQGKDVRIDFAVDHTLPPENGDIRTLGIIVNEVGLVAK